MALIFIVSVAIFLVLAISLRWNIFSKEKRLPRIPGPTPLPIMGNVFEFTKREEILNTFVSYMKKYGGTYQLMFGPKVFIMVTDPGLIERLVNGTDYNEKSDFYRFLHNWLGSGLLTSSGEKWQKHRKIITPTFHFKILEKFVITFDRHAEILIETLKAFSGGQDFDISTYIHHCTLDVICETAMGISMNAQQVSNSPYVESVKDMSEIFIRRLLSPLKQVEYLYKCTSDYKLERKSIDILHTTTLGVIKKRKAYIESNEYVEDEENKKYAFLDTLLMKGLSIEDIRNEVDTFMFEGHDTTGAAITFVLYSLSLNPEIQERVYEEQKSIYRYETNKEITYADLQIMSYLEKVIKESMRLYPPVPSYARKIHKDLKYKDFVLPEGSTATIFPFGLHRNPKYFPDPEKFDPERFSLENSRQRSPYMYLPFSAGARNCIGQKYAMLEMKSILSKVIRNYRILPCPNFKPLLLPDVVLKSLIGVRVKIEARSLT